MTATDTAPAMTISESAARRIAAVRAAENRDGARLRVSVAGGGCSGFQYGFDFDDTLNAEDHVFERNGVEIVVDAVSLEFLRGAELDFVEELMGAYFKIENPNAASSCGCGSSFSI